MAGALTKAGRYQIVSELGRGSMGVVYQGYDPVIGRTVAIKTMLTEGLGPQEFQEYKARFQREAQAAGALTHPNIVTVYDFGEDSGLLYLAMELLEGKSLDSIVEAQNILPIETIIPMYDQVCSALDHAHMHKIVHRDIKPANIMILDSGLVKVTDFGIAKMMSLGMTQAGQILGTPNYMSPEQVKGRQVDGRADIFSLGVILYELVTGEMPFGAQNITTVIYKIINENPTPPRELDATIPQGLSYVICKALAKNPDERYQTCREFAEDLKNYKSLGGMTAPAATVILRVPPLQAPPAEPAAQAPIRAEAPPAAAPPQAPIRAEAPPAAAPPVEQPPQVRQVSVQVIPPVTARSQQHGPSLATGVMFAILILGALGVGGYYFVVLKPQQQNRNAVIIPPPPVNPVPTTGTLTVSSDPAGATITIDGKGEADWVTPKTFQEYALGTHQVTLSKPGYDDATSSVTIEAGKAGNVNATLTAQAQQPQQPETSTGVPLPGRVTARTQPTSKVGTLMVSSDPTGAKITIDGQTRPDWVTPKTFQDYPAGTYQVTLSKPGFEDATNSVTVDAGKTANLIPTLGAPTGELNVVTTPPGLPVLIDGQPVGKSPVHKILPVGQHTWTVIAPGREPYTKPVEVTSGAILKRGGDFGVGVAASATGVVTVRTIPAGANVVADGTPLEGSTPISFSLSVGRHKLAFSLPDSGIRPKEQIIDVKPGDNPVNVILK
jgi:hypothetical protein